MHHSIKRVIERVPGIKSESQALAFIRKGIIRGATKDAFTEYDKFWGFLSVKENALRKILKVYKGYILVCNRTRRTGTGVTTVYKIPDVFDTELIERLYKDATCPSYKYIEFNIWGQCKLKVVLPSNLRVGDVGRRCDVVGGGSGYGGRSVSDLDVAKMLFKSHFPKTPGISYCLKENGIIERDFKPVGKWRYTIPY